MYLEHSESVVAILSVICEDSEAFRAFLRSKNESLYSKSRQKQEGNDAENYSPMD